ncbi:hypothetical protein SHKM778_15070 [Streptomyces sp. KM77-8]|uniref:DNA 3'-5' helicase n=1 Tax=Streptomyces haneummycinicus TaxID=3074435 RepID=A0AAT9HCJ7_9ACTN
MISTYHAFAGRLLTDHGLRIGLEPSSRLLADATRYQLAARVLREAPGLYPALTRSFPDLVGDLLTLDSELSEHLVRPEDLRAHDAELLNTLEHTGLTNADLRKVPDAAAARRELADLVLRYRTAKRERDLLDFGDQIALSARLAALPEVGRVLRDEFRVVLLDEYQDTSVAQRVLLAGLFGGGTGHPVTAVGDPCQAIYGWRGASVANLDDFPEHFAGPDGRPATRQSLSENRRSGGRLLDLANGLAEPLRAMHAGVEALRPAPGAEQDGTVRCALLPTHAEEIDWIAGSIAHLVNTGKAPGEIAVLCRTAGDFAEIQAALVARDVPVEVVGLSGLLHLPEIADLVAVCEVLQDPGANASLVRLLTGPRWRIGPRDLALLGRRARLLVSHTRVDGDDDPDRRLAEAVEGTDPAEVISLADALDTFLGTSPDGPGADGLPFSPDARVRFARLATELRDLRLSLSAPSWTSCTASSPSPAWRSNSPPPPRPRRPPPRNPLQLPRRRRLLRRGRRGGNPARLPRLPAHRRPVREGPGQRAARRREHRQGPHRAQVQGPRMGRRRRPRTGHRHLPQQPGTREVDRSGQGAAARAARRRRHPARRRVLGLPGPESLPRRHEGPPAHRGTPPRLRHLHPPPLPAPRLRPLVGPQPEEAARPLRVPPRPLRALRRRTRRDRGVGGRARRGRGEPRPAPGRRRPGVAPAPRRRRPHPPPRGRRHRPRPPRPPRRPPGRPRHGRTRPRHPRGPGLAATARRRGPLPEEDDPFADAGPDDWDSWTADRPALPHQATAPETTTRAPAAETEQAHPPRPRLTPEEARTVASWDRDLDALTGELLRTRESVTEVLLPASLTATQLLRLAADPDGFARELARPMPRPPQPAARRGTRFHAWVEARFEELTLPMLDPDELPGSDAEIADERDLEALKEAFERTEYAHRTPTAWKRPSSSRSPAASSVAASTPSTRRTTGTRRRTRSSTGRPAAATTPTRSSSPSTGSPGPNDRASPGDRQGRLPVRTHGRGRPARRPARPRRAGTAAPRRAGR